MQLVGLDSAVSRDTPHLFTEDELAFRKQFARFAAKTAMDEFGYASKALYCETVVANSSVVTSNPGAAKAAAALMALEALGKSSPGNTLISDCLQALYPVIFADYDPVRKAVPHGVMALLGTNERLSSNPVFSHSFAIETHHRSSGAVAQMERLMHQAAASANGRRAAVIRVFARESGASLKLHFTAWRGFTRRHRADEMGRRLRQQRDAAGERTRLLQAVFYSWKWVTERAMCTVLEERLHNTTFQLDNAKNQFQLQCFRSDRYLRTVEELRRDMHVLRDNRDKYRAEVRALELQLRDQQLAAREHVDRISHRLLLGLNQWKSVATACVDRGRVPTELMGILSEAKIDRLKRAANTGPEDDDADSMNTEGIERMISKWVNGILVQSAVASKNAISNFAADFADGSVVLVLLHHVFPDSIPYTPLQDNNVMRRLELIGELAASVGIAHFPSTTDFAEGASDIIFTCVVELFLTHSMGGLLVRPHPTEADVPHILYDSTMVEGAMADNDSALTKLFATQLENDVSMDQVRTWLSSVSAYAAYLTRERMGGHPVQLSDPKELAKYTRLRASRIGDLEFKYQSSSTPWPEQVAQLRASVRKYFPLFKRIFGFYAGDNPSITEPNFWRFIGDLGLIDKTLTKVKVERIFVVANRDDDVLVESGSESGSEEDAENPITELIPSEFVECIIRIGDQKMQGKTIVERVESLVSTTLKTFGNKQAHMNKFRKEVYDKTCQSVVDKYARDLARVFNYFAKQGKNLDKQAKKNQLKYVGQQDIMSIMREGGVLQGSVDESVIHTVLRSVLGDEVSDSVAFHDFMECLAATAVFKIPNPFVPLDKKLDVTLSHLISNLRLKLRGSVTLTDVKPIPLSQTMGKRA